MPLIVHDDPEGVYRQYHTRTGPLSKQHSSILTEGSSIAPRIPEVPPGCTLSERDAEYLEARGVSRATAEAAGCYTATRPSEVPAAFSERQRRRVPALIVPHVSPSSAVGYQKRDHYPGKDRRGRLMKWVSPKGAWSVLACHPWTVEAVRSGSGAVWVVEGVTRMMALAELGIPAVSYAGCYSWQRGGAPLEDWDSVNLERLVYDVPDADARTNWQVQTMQAARVLYLESRGARVLAVSVPEVNGDEHAGLDDYLADGGDLETLVMNAAPFEAADVGAARITKDERLRRFVAAKVPEAAGLPARKARECNAAKVARFLAAELAPARGKVRPRGVEVRASFREIAEGVRLGSLQTVANALDELDGDGFLVIQRAPKGGRAASSYLLLDPAGGKCALGVHVEGRVAGGEESLEGGGKKETSLYQRDSYTSVHPTHIPPDPRTLPDAPALRNSKLVHTFEYEGRKRIVVDSQYFRRYGSKRELIVRYLLECGAYGVETAELMEKFGSRTARPGRFFETWLKPMVDDGVMRGDLESVELAPDWREALERVRERTDEDGDNQHQSEKYKRQRVAYRKRIEAERRGEVPEPEPVPELAGPQRVAEIFAADAERDHAARVEEQRRKAGVTAAVFLADEMADAPAMRWREMRERWIMRGGRGGDLRAAVVAGPFGFRREPGDDGNLYVYAAKTRGAESLKAASEKDPAEVVPMRPDLTKPDTGEPPGHRPDPFRNNCHARPPMLTNDDIGDAPRRHPLKVGGVFVHGPDCSCWICGDEEMTAPVKIGALA
jgi:hypothetical protein